MTRHSDVGKAKHGCSYRTFDVINQQGKLFVSGWIRLLGPSSPNVVSRPQTPRARNFLGFDDFIEFTSWFLREWGPICQNWS